MILIAMFLVGVDITFKPGGLFDLVPEQLTIQVPRGLSSDKDGNIYVLDGGSKTVLIWDKNGKYLGHFGRPGQGPGELSMKNSMGMITVLDDEVIIYDESSKKIHFWGTDREYRRTMPLPGYLERARQMYTVGDTIVLVNQSTDRGVHEVLALDRNFSKKKQLFEIKSQTFSKNRWGFHDYRPIAPRILIDVHEDQIYVGNSDKNEIIRMDVNGKRSKTYRVPMTAAKLYHEDKAYFIDSFSTWAGDKDRIFFPKDDAVIDFIILQPELDVMLAYQFKRDEGRCKGVGISMETGKILSRFETTLGDDITFMVQFHGRFLIADINSDGDYRVREVRCFVNESSENKHGG